MISYVWVSAYIQQQSVCNRVSPQTVSTVCSLPSIVWTSGNVAPGPGALFGSQTILMQNLSTPWTENSGTTLYSSGPKLVLFGGVEGLQTFPQPKIVVKGELWVLDLTQQLWHLMGMAGAVWPPPRSLHSISARDVTTVVVYGGLGSSTENFPYLDDLWVYDFLKQVWIGLPSGPSLAAHSANIIGNIMFIFGGSSDLYSVSDAMYSFNFSANTWSLVAVKSITLPPLSSVHGRRVALESQGSLPAGRMSHTMVVLDTPLGQRMVLFGGIIPNYLMPIFLNDIWSFDPFTYTWTEMSVGVPAPPGMAGHCAWALSLSRMAVLGGGADMLSNQLWVWSWRTQLWTHISAVSMPLAFSQVCVMFQHNIFVAGGASQPLSAYSLMFDSIGSFYSTSNFSNISFGCNPGFFSPDFNSVDCIACPIGKKSH